MGTLDGFFGPAVVMDESLNTVYEREVAKYTNKLNAAEADIFGQLETAIAGLEAGDITESQALQAAERVLSEFNKDLAAAERDLAKQITAYEKQQAKKEQAATRAKNKKSNEADSMATATGYSFESFKVSSFSNWSIPLYHVVNNSVPVDKDYPILLQSEPGFNAEMIVANSDWIPKLTDLGYDVWIGGYAGDVGSSGGSGTNEQKAEAGRFDNIGMNDIPAMIEQIRTVTGADKINFVGHSQGNAAMFYGLAHREANYFANVVNRVIAAAPCVFKPSRFSDWESIASKYYGLIEKAGILYEESDPRLRQRVDQGVCDQFGSFSTECRIW